MPLALRYPTANLPLRPSHPRNGISTCAAGNFVTELLDVGDFRIQPTDRVVQDGKRRALIGIVGDAEVTGPLPRPQRLVEPRSRCLEVAVQGVDDTFGIL